MITTPYRKSEIAQLEKLMEEVQTLKKSASDNGLYLEHYYETLSSLQKQYHSLTGKFYHFKEKNGRN